MNINEALQEYKAGSNSKINLERLSVILKHIQTTMDFKVGARGWCYILEGSPYNLLTKDKFGIVGDSISRCRHKGYLPWNFCVTDDTRSSINIIQPDTENIDTYISKSLLNTCFCDINYIKDFWETQNYYVEILVEKTDIRELFKTVCENYYVPIGTGRGWSDINQRCNMMLRFKEAQEKCGCRPVLLYAGDFDPSGIQISDKLRKNYMDLSNAVDWIPNKDNLIIERFSLNYDFIIQNNLSWINDLKTSTGKDLSNPQHNMYDSLNISNYIQQYGCRKCELNSLVIQPIKGRELCEKAINKYITKQDVDHFNIIQQGKRDEIIKRIEELGLPEIYDSISSYKYSDFRK